MPGPNVFTGIVIRELAGDFETYTVPEVSCGFGQYTLQASASCDGTTLQINIPVGDSPFHIVNSAGEYRTLYGVGTHLLTDYWPATGIIIRERTGDYESVTLGDIPCVAPTPTPTATNTPTETPEPPTETPPLPVALPDYVPARVMQIAAIQAQIVYDQPGGEPIRNPDHSLLTLPQDSDGNGWDTFVVLDAQIYEGEVWLGVYLGGPELGWLPESSFVVPQD